MNEKKSSERGPGRGVEADYRGMTPNQVVAYNLTRARQLRGWTQDQAADALAPFLGTRWSKASFSQAERSVAGRFIRQFHADEVVAFARAFELPITWFFLPPPAWDGDRPARLSVPDARRYGLTLAALIDLVFGTGADQSKLAARLSEFSTALGPERITDAQQQIADAAAQRIAAATRQQIGDIQQWEACLRAMAGFLADVRAAAEGWEDTGPTQN